MKADKLFNEIKRVLEDYRMIHTKDEDGEGQQLIDHLSTSNDTTVKTGSEELEDITESLFVYFVNKQKRAIAELKASHKKEITKQAERIKELEYELKNANEAYGNLREQLSEKDKQHNTEKLQIELKYNEDISKLNEERNHYEFQLDLAVDSIQIMALEIEELKEHHRKYKISDCEYSEGLNNKIEENDIGIKKLITAYKSVLKMGYDVDTGKLIKNLESLLKGTESESKLKQVADKVASVESLFERIENIAFEDGVSYNELKDKIKKELQELKQIVGDK